MKLCRFACAFWFLLVASTLHAQQHYVFTTIDFPATDAVGQSALAINDQDQIVGGYSINGDPTLYGYLLENGQFTTIIVGREGGALRGINNSGQLSGFFDNRQGIHAFLYSLRFGIKKNIDIDGANLTEGIGLNDFLQEVGDYRDAATGVFHGFLVRDGSFTMIDFPGAESTGPSDINNLGEIVGFYFGNVNDPHGFVRFSNGQFQTIDVPFPGAKETFVRGNNDQGVMVGSYYDGTRNHGFRFDASRGFVRIDIPHAADNEVLGINNSDVIVGRYIDAAGVSHGFTGVPVIQ